MQDIERQCITGIPIAPAMFKSPLQYRQLQATLVSRGSIGADQEDDQAHQNNADEADVDYDRVSELGEVPEGECVDDPSKIFPCKIVGCHAVCRHDLATESSIFILSH